MYAIQVNPYLKGAYLEVQPVARQCLGSLNRIGSDRNEEEKVDASSSPVFSDVCRTLSSLTQPDASQDAKNEHLAKLSRNHQRWLVHGFLFYNWTPVRGFVDEFSSDGGRLSIALSISSPSPTTVRTSEESDYDFSLPRSFTISTQAYTTCLSKLNLYGALAESLYELPSSLAHVVVKALEGHPTVLQSLHSVLSATDLQQGTIDSLFDEPVDGSTAFSLLLDRFPLSDAIPPSSPSSTLTPEHTTPQAKEVEEDELSSILKDLSLSCDRSHSSLPVVSEDASATSKTPAQDQAVLEALALWKQLEDVSSEHKTDSGTSFFDTLLQEGLKGLLTAISIASCTRSDEKGVLYSKTEEEKKKNDKAIDTASESVCAFLFDRYQFVPSNIFSSPSASTTNSTHTATATTSLEPSSLSSVPDSLTLGEDFVPRVANALASSGSTAWTALAHVLLVVRTKGVNMAALEYKKNGTAINLNAEVAHFWYQWLCWYEVLLLSLSQMPLPRLAELRRRLYASSPCSFDDVFGYVAVHSYVSSCVQAGVDVTSPRNGQLSLLLPSCLPRHAPINQGCIHTVLNKVVDTVSESGNPSSSSSSSLSVDLSLLLLQSPRVVIDCVLEACARNTGRWSLFHTLLVECEGKRMRHPFGIFFVRDLSNSSPIFLSSLLRLLSQCHDPDSLSGIHSLLTHSCDVFNASWPLMTLFVSGLIESVISPLLSSSSGDDDKERRKGGEEEGEQVENDSFLASPPLSYSLPQVRVVVTVLTEVLKHFPSTYSDPLSNTIASSSSSSAPLASFPPPLTPPLRPARSIDNNNGSSSSSASTVGSKPTDSADLSVETKHVLVPFSWVLYFPFRLFVVSMWRLEHKCRVEHQVGSVLLSPVVSCMVRYERMLTSTFADLRDASTPILRDVSALLSLRLHMHRITQLRTTPLRTAGLSFLRQSASSPKVGKTPAPASDRPDGSPIVVEFTTPIFSSSLERPAIPASLKRPRLSLVTAVLAQRLLEWGAAAMNSSVASASVTGMCMDAASHTFSESFEKHVRHVCMCTHSKEHTPLISTVASSSSSTSTSSKASRRPSSRHRNPSSVGSLVSCCHVCVEIECSESVLSEFLDGSSIVNGDLSPAALEALWHLLRCGPLAVRAFSSALVYLCGVLSPVEWNRALSFFDSTILPLHTTLYECTRSLCVTEDLIPLSLSPCAFILSVAFHRVLVVSSSSSSSTDMTSTKIVSDALLRYTRRPHKHGGNGNKNVQLRETEEENGKSTLERVKRVGSLLLLTLDPVYTLSSLSTSADQARSLLLGEATSDFSSHLHKVAMEDWPEGRVLVARLVALLRLLPNEPLRSSLLKNLQ